MELEDLVHTVDDLRRRIEALEHRETVPEPAFSAAVLPQVETASSDLLAALGRLLLGLAGAYLLRAVTESALLPQFAGTLLGFLYAAAWLGFSLRIQSHNRLMIAVPALTASLIVAPLLWESTVRFQSLSHLAGAAALALFLIEGQLVAWRRDHSLIAGITAFAGCATAVALIVATLDPLPFIVALIPAAILSEYRAFHLRWIIAFVLDFCAFLLIYLVARPQGLPEGYAPLPHAAPIVIPILVTAICLAGVLFRRRQITVFEIVQLTASATLAVVATWQIPNAAAVMGVLGVICYVIACAKASGRNYHVLCSCGFLLLFLATFEHPLIWSALGLIAAWIGQRRNSNTFRLHGAGFITATFLLSAPLGAVAGPLAYAITLHRRPTTWQSHVAPAIFAAISCCSIVLLIPPGVSRTVFFVAAALVFAWCGRNWKFRELIWILYPWMALGAVKLLIEDFQQGRSATLFVSLFLYGCTLLVLPRLVRRARPAQSDLS